MDSLGTWLLLILVPALALSILAQLYMQFVFASVGVRPTKMSGYAIARHVLDGSGLYEVQVEQVPGSLSDHFDARRHVLQLSGDVYHGRNIAALAVAAHEACHALQQARGSRLLSIRELAIPAASYGSGGGILLAVAGLIGRFPPLLAWGITLFSAALYLQVLSLPIEIEASLLARRRLEALGVLHEDERSSVRWALAAAALTSVGATLQSVFTLAQRLVLRAGRRSAR